MGWYAGSLELQSIAQRQVDVPFCIVTTDYRHLKACLFKGLVDLITHLETIETDTWSYLCHHVLRMSAIGFYHLVDSHRYDALHSASPPCMDGTDGMMLRVVEQHGDTVGRRDTNAHTTDIGHQGIHTLHLLLLFAGRKLQEGLIDDSHLCQMHLMRHHHLMVADTKQLAQGLTVLMDGLRLIATIAVDIEFTIIPLTISPSTGGAKGNDAFAKIIVSEFWMYHFCMFCVQRYEKKVIKHHENKKIRIFVGKF